MKHILSGLTDPLGKSQCPWESHVSPVNDSEKFITSIYLHAKFSLILRSVIKKQSIDCDVTIYNLQFKAIFIQVISSNSEENSILKLNSNQQYEHQYTFCDVFEIAQVFLLLKRTFS